MLSLSDLQVNTRPCSQHTYPEYHMVFFDHPSRGGMEGSPIARSEMEAPIGRPLRLDLDVHKI